MGGAISEDLAIHVSSVIRRGAGLHPGREAIVFGDQRLTYGDLAVETDRIVAALGRDGLVPGSRVALLGRNCVDYALGLLALARRGMVAVPLNWRLSDHALAGTAGKYEPEGLLYTAEFSEAAAALRAATPSIRAALCLDGRPAPATAPAPPPTAAAPPPGAAAPRDAPLPSPTEAAQWVAANARAPRREDLFAFISTGGTEGLPKGVPISNAMVEACVIGLLGYEPLYGTDVTLVLPQMFHNPQLYVIAPLMVGGKMVIPTMPSFDSDLVLRTIESEGVTRFLGVATMMAYLLDAQDRIGVDLSSLRTISYGGSPFAARTVKRLIETFDCDLMQLYGQTETSVVVSALRPEDHRAALADPSLAHRLESAGQPIATVEVRVLDDDGAEVPHDRETVGEVVARSPATMRGYHDNPELTAKKLRDGWCYTGDLAVWDEEGYLYIVDRRNEMIISGGENVYPSAVEAVVRDVPGVEDVVVIGVPDEVWGEVVTAVVLPYPKAEVSTEAISTLCDERLAGYMRPRAIEFLDEFPKNPSGKVLRGEIKQRYAKRVGRV